MKYIALILTICLIIVESQLYFLSIKVGSHEQTLNNQDQNFGTIALTQTASSDTLNTLRTNTNSAFTNIANILNNFSTSTANSFSAKQSFSYASTSQLSATSSAWFATTNGNVAIGTTSPTWLLNVFSSTAGQLALSAGAGAAQWVFRANAGGNLAVATTSVAGTATSTTNAFTIIGSSGNFGIGSTSPQGLFTVQGASSGSATKGTCFRAKDVGASTFSYFWFKAGVQTTSATDCGGSGTTTITFD